MFDVTRETSDATHEGFDPTPGMSPVEDAERRDRKVDERK